MCSDHQFICLKCGREYKRYTCYTKHEVLCTKMSDIKTIDNSKSVVMQTLDELIKSNEKLKQEVTQLKKITQSQHQKLIIIDWLNKTYKPEQNYKEYIESIPISRQELETIFENDLIEGIKIILLNNLDNNNNHSCKAFDQKSKKLYVFNQKNGWNLLSIEEFGQQLLIISKKIMNEWEKWRIEHQDKIYEEPLSTIFLTNLKKVISGNVSLEKTKRNIYHSIYNRLKKNLKSVEYEII